MEYLKDPKVIRSLVKEHESISKASKEEKTNVSNIYSVLKEKRKSAGGYKWTY